MKHLPVSSRHDYVVSASNHEFYETNSWPKKMIGEPQVSLIDYLNIFKRRKWTILASLAITMVVVIIMAAIEEPVFESKATIIVEKNIPSTISIQGMPWEDNSPLTEIEIITDRSLLEKVLDKTQVDKSNIDEDNASFLKKTTLSIIGLIHDFFSHTKIVTTKLISPTNDGQYGSIASNDAVQRQALLDKFQSSLKVNLREGTKLIDVSMVGNDPYDVFTKIDTLVNLYIKDNLNRKLHETRKSVEWLEKEVEKLERKIYKSESSLHKFREDRSFVSYEKSEQQNPLFKSINDLNELHISSKNERRFVEKQIEQVKNLSPRTDLSKFSDIFVSSESIVERELFAKYVDLKSSYKELLQNYKEKHPQVISIKQKMSELKEIIINQLSGRYKILLNKEESLQDELRKYKSDAIDYERNIGDYESLRREYEVNRNIYMDVLKKLRESSLAEALETNNIKVISPASLPISPLSSGMLYKILAGVLAGLGIGAGLCLVTEYVDRRFKSAQEVEASLRIPFLGILPRHSSARHSTPSFLLSQSTSFEAEAYRILRTRLQLSPLGPVKTLLITSALPAEGKSTTAVNLGLAFAQLGQRVLLVDVDLRHPSLHRHFHMPNQLGLVEVLAQKVTWHQALQNTPVQGLQLLSTGMVRHIPSELLPMKAFERLLAQLRAMFDTVIFDAPPVLALSDVEILAPKMDGVLLVHNPEKEDKEAVLEAKTTIERTNTPIIGVVFNNIDMKKNRYNHQRFAYHYYSPQ